ncbi:MAG: DUF3179 domain-containing protein [Chloroflexi bacterium]|nr:DUF3179 domain-containing protein [Chloroflexota bacterium]
MRGPAGHLCACSPNPPEPRYEPPARLRVQSIRRLRQHQEQPVSVLRADGRSAAANGRVATVEVNGDTVAYPFSQLTRVHVINDVVDGTPLVVFHQGGTKSALDGPVIAASRDVGAAAVFARSVAGNVLTFSWLADQFIDDQTNSTWDIFGRATTGSFAGQRVRPLLNANHFWFAWAIFKPETRVWAP